MNYFLSKSVALVLAASSLVGILHAQSNSDQAQYMRWEVQSLAVYESGALIQRSSRVSIDESGRAVITIGGLAKDIDTKSIQTALPLDWGLSGHSFQISKDPEAMESAMKELNELDIEVKSTERIRAMREALLAVYAEELTMIQANRKVGGAESLLVEDLTDLANFWRDRVKELEYLMLELRMELRDINDELKVFSDERQEILNLLHAVEGQITLRIVGPANSAGTIEIGYVAEDAFWKTAYDAEVHNDGTVALKRFAHVVQKTGADWNDLPIQFFAGNPLESLLPPKRMPLELSLVRSSGSKNGIDWPLSKTSQHSVYADSPAEVLESNPIQEGAAVQRLVFTPALPVSVSGDGTPERIPLETLNLKSDLTYLILPEYSDESFQLASSADWYEAQLMEGAVQVVAGNAYRGVYDLTLPAPGDTLEIPLGQDGRVRSSRKRIAERCSNSAFGSTKRTEQAFQISLVNQHNRTVHVRVMDRAPISKKSNVNVTVENLDGGVFDPTTGWITWNFTLAPSAQKNVSFSYKIEYPKKFVIQGL